MHVGVVTEIKDNERRVALTPAGVRALAARGHRVLVEADAGLGAGIADAEYVAAGAVVHDRAEDVWGASDLLLKVKEPVEAEYPHFRGDLALFTYLHLAPNPTLTQALVESGITAIAYETVEDEGGRLPLLTPMSEIAGRLAAQAGAYYLQQPVGGPGVLMSGAPGVAPARVLVVGGGVVGANAAQVAVGMGADVTILDVSLERLRALEHQFATRARVLLSDDATFEQESRRADLIIGAVLVSGARPPHLLRRSMLPELREHAVLVDVAIDQGGCFETSRPTTHAEPVYEVDGVLHYCVANMPGGVPWTSTRALTAATLPYITQLADGIDEALEADPGLRLGLNVHQGRITCAPVAAALGQPPLARTLT